MIGAHAEHGNASQPNINWSVSVVEIIGAELPVIIEAYCFVGERKIFNLKEVKPHAKTCAFVVKFLDVEVGHLRGHRL